MKNAVWWKMQSEFGEKCKLLSQEMHIYIKFCSNFKVSRNPGSFFFFNAILVCLRSFFNLCMYVWLCWVFVSVRGLSPAVASGGHSSSRCAGLSPSRPLVAEHRLQTRRLSNCGSRAESLRGMWDLPKPGPEPVSPALAGGLSTTAPPGKPPKPRFLKWKFWAK